MLGSWPASATFASRPLLGGHSRGGRAIIAQLLIRFERREEQPDLIGAQLLALRPIESAQQVLQLRLRPLTCQRLELQRRLQLTDLPVRRALSLPQQLLQRLVLRTERSEFIGRDSRVSGVHVGVKYTQT